MAECHARTRLVGNQAVLQHKAVNHCEGVEIGCLVNHTASVLCIKDGWMCLNVAKAEVVGGRLVAHKAAIHVHSIHHREGSCGCGVAIVCAFRHPDRQVSVHDGVDDGVVDVG